MYRIQGIEIEGDSIKKLAFILCVVVVATALAGCTGANSGENPFAIYNSYENLQVKIGDNRDNVARLMGIDEQYVTVFEEDGIERVTYWEYENVGIDYDVKSNIVIGMRIENTQWSIFNGIKVGDSTDTVKKQYPDYEMNNSLENYLFVAYDNSGNIIEYSDNAPYFVAFGITGGKVEEILVRNNAAYPDE